MKILDDHEIVDLTKSGLAERNETCDLRSGLYADAASVAAHNIKAMLIRQVGQCAIDLERTIKLTKPPNEVTYFGWLDAELINLEPNQLKVTIV